MPDEAQLLEERKNALAKLIENDVKKYMRDARSNYITAQGLSWGSLIASAAAGLLGLIPSTVDKWVVGLLAAISTALVAASQKQGFQRKANWHYRKVDRLKALLGRLLFELPLSPSPNNIAAISSTFSEVNSQMSREWEDLQNESATRPQTPAPTPTPTPTQTPTSATQI